MTATTAPAEVTKPGTAVQRINAYNPDGTWMRQVKHHGTEAEARAYVASLATHR